MAASPRAYDAEWKAQYQQRLTAKQNIENALARNPPNFALALDSVDLVLRQTRLSKQSRAAWERAGSRLMERQAAYAAALRFPRPDADAPWSEVPEPLPEDPSLAGQYEQLMSSLLYDEATALAQRVCKSLGAGEAVRTGWTVRLDTALRLQGWVQAYKRGDPMPEE